MNAYLIDPFARTVTAVEYDDSDYRNIYPLIEAQAFAVATFDQEHDDGVYVDDVGLFVPNQRFFMIRDYPEPLAGKGLVLGLDIETGETIAPWNTLEEVRARVRFLDIVKIDGAIEIMVSPDQPHLEGA